jgi:hypothetical protein
MCNTGFSYALIGNEMMIMCRTADCQRKKIKELFKQFFGLYGKALRDLTIDTDARVHSSKFDCKTEKVRKNHDWAKQPFMALWILEKAGKTYCAAKAVS